jgi:phage baseplate assembly protein W
MEYIVTMDDAVNFAPGTETEEILQNVRTILKTRIGMVPLDRDLGVSWDFIDQPIPVAKALYQEAVIDAILAYEPRASIVSVKFDEDTEVAMDGVLKPTVIVNIGED